MEANKKQNKTGVAVPMSDKTVLYNDKGINPAKKSNNCKYLCNNTRAPKYIWQLLTDIKTETDNDTTVGDCNTPLTCKHKICKETEALSDTVEQMDLRDPHRTFHPKAEYAFPPCTHGTFSRTDHMLGHKRHLNKFKKTEILSSIFIHHNSM